MKPDAGLQPTRDIRRKISLELGNDPRRLVEYYVAYQSRFKDRLRPAPGTVKVREAAAEQVDAVDRTSEGR
jgi:hypothetical protein